jgi:hypothetical protein
VKRVGRLVSAGIVAATMCACGSVRTDGLGGGASTPSALADGGTLPDGGPRPDGATTLPPGPRPDGGAAAAASGLQLRGARFTDGFLEHGWQCSGTLCLKGRIAP